MEKCFRVMPYMCNQQVDELNQLLHAADEIGAAATSVIAQGGQGYNLLLEAREKFKETLFNFATRYRICVEEDE